MAKRKTITQLSDLTPDTQNANKGTERGRYMVEASLTETGAGRSIVADKDGRIIAGNKTLEAWAGMGGAVKVVETDGHELVVVQRTDLDLSDPKGKARKLAYYDNRAGQVGLEWDAEQLLADVNAGVDLAAMFKPDEIAELLAGAGGQGDADAEPQIDQAEELNKKWQVKAGDLWRIGAHRLLCGDSTKAADVARVMGRERADMVFTDPPYGVMYESSKKNAISGDLSQVAIPLSFKVMLESATAEDARLYICGGSGNAPMYYSLFDAYLQQMPRLIVWVKESFVMRPNNYHSQFELVYFGWKGKGGDPKHWHGDRKMSDVWDERRDATADYVHPTQKPTALAERAVRNSCPLGGLVYEPFSGSGSTLVACENLGRKCRAIEISPAYCAVILERMAQAFPKLEITRDDGAG